MSLRPGYPHARRKKGWWRPSFKRWLGKIQQSSRPRPLFEPLEPRLLLSADLTPYTYDMDAEHNELLVQLQSLGGVDQLAIIDNSADGDGEVLDTVALTNLDSFLVRGTAQDDVLTIDATVPIEIPLTFLDRFGAGQR